MKVFFYISLCLCLANCTQANEGERLKLLERAILDFNSAFSEYDVEKLNQLTTDDYLHINGSSAPIQKRDWLDYLTKRKNKMDEGKLLIRTYEFSDVNILMKRHSAFVTGLIHVEGIEDGVAFSSLLRVSNFWVNDAGTWKRSGFHDARIEP